MLVVSKYCRHYSLSNYTISNIYTHIVEFDLLTVASIISTEF